jgi:hypothetical protein
MTKKGKRNRYYIVVFTKPFTYKCFTYNHPGETVRDENQVKLFRYANPMPEVTWPRCTTSSSSIHSQFCPQSTCPSTLSHSTTNLTRNCFSQVCVIPSSYWNTITSPLFRCNKTHMRFALNNRSLIAI